MQTEIKTAKISEIKLNPDNPRTISNKDMELLIKSLKEFPEMLHLREIVVDENMVVLGGNMRLLALQKMGASDCQIRMVSGLTPEQKREFVIKDNSNFGRYDFDSLANEWSDLPLVEWGVDLPEDWLKEVGEVDAPELKDGDRAPFIQMTFTLHDTQAEELNAAIKKAKNEGGGQSAVNENSNGNALYFIAQRFNRG